MNMKEYTKMLKNMFQFQGRARRREYWVVAVINSALCCLLYAVLFITCTVAGDSLCYKDNGTFGFNTEGSTVGTIMVFPIVLAIIYCTVCILGLTVRRYHDAGVPGWVFPICILGCCLCGIGAIAHLVICLLPSREDNIYGENPKKPENNEYEESGSIVVAVVMYIICLMLMVTGVMLNVTKCGLKQQSDEVDLDSKGETREISTTEVEEPTATEENETEIPDWSKQDSESYVLTIGTSSVVMEPPAGAENVYTGDYILSYECRNINVRYSDSFYKVTEDALDVLKEKYASLTSDVEEWNASKSIEPQATMVGTCNAYYYKVVNTYSEDFEFVYYSFLVDIGADDYLEVNIYGSPDDLTDADAFEIADLKL